MSPASKMTFNLVTNEDGGYITIFMPGASPLPCSDQHPNYSKVVSLAVEAEAAYKAGDPATAEDKAAEAVALVNVEQTVRNQFAVLSERVTVRDGVVYLDGDSVDNTLTDQILQFMDEGEDFGPLVAFYENLLGNTNDHSRVQFYDWLKTRSFTITEDGSVVGYKAVEDDPNGQYRSTMAGPAIVNGVPHAGGKVPQKDGDVVEMARSEVTHDPSIGCSSGLHVGTFEYAKAYGGGKTILEVRFNPRDVVSVPTDSYMGLVGEKVRVCRYTVVGSTEAKHETALLKTVAEPETPEADDQTVAESVQAMRDALGRWVAGRPGSARDSKGRFAG